MKGKVVEPTTVFKPIEITLETEEEAAGLWHLANAAIGVPLNEYPTSRVHGTIKEIVESKDKLYNVIKSLYMPRLDDC